MNLPVKKTPPRGAAGFISSRRWLVPSWTHVGYVKYSGSVCKIISEGQEKETRRELNKPLPTFRSGLGRQQQVLKAAWFATPKFRRRGLSYRSACNAEETLLASSAVIPAKLKGEKKKVSDQKGEYESGRLSRLLGC